MTETLLAQPLLKSESQSLLQTATGNNTALNPADAPIGVFDSGVGGLSVVLEIQKLLPHEKIYYFADTAHVPYGSRTDEEIRQYTLNAVDFLYKQGCKAIVVACNTASAFSLDALRSHYGNSLPIIGLVPALKPAVEHTQSKVVGVLATSGTFRGQLLNDVIEHIATPAGVHVMSAVDASLVPLVEAGLQHTQACKYALTKALTPLVEAGADYLVLGCTHYPFLAKVIEEIFPHQFRLIDSGAAVARRTKHVLEQRNWLNPHLNSYPLTGFVSGDLATASTTIKQLLHDANECFEASILTLNNTKPHTIELHEVDWHGQS